MRNITKKLYTVIVTLVIASILGMPINAVTLWVGQSYTWDFSGQIMGSTYNMNVSSNGGYLSVTGSGFYRKITPTKYFSGDATVTAEWDYYLYYGGPKLRGKATVTVSCRENPVSIYPTSVTLSPGETYQLSYSHSYSNEYLGYANAYFSGGNTHFSVISDGLITASSPGSGTVVVYSNLSSSLNPPVCYVTVQDVEPTSASTGDYSLYADQSTDLSVTVSPSNATIRSKEWFIKNGSDVVSISGSRLKGLKPGNAEVYCMVNGSVRSNDGRVTVQEPKLTIVGEQPKQGSDSISVFVTPSITYSHDIFQGSEYDSIVLKAGDSEVEGAVEISGPTVRFTPSVPLKPFTAYTFTVPGSAVKNKWGSPAQTDRTISFTTGDLVKVNLEFVPAPGSYITTSERVRIKADPSEAQIYYTLDGSTPDVTGTPYTDPIEIGSDVTIKAIAACDGYKDSDIIEGNFFKSQSEIVEYCPTDNEPLFNYGLINPYIRFSGTVVESNNFRLISFKNNQGDRIEGKAYLADHIIVFVPEESLENASTYTMEIPYDAVRTENGEIFKGFSWSFSTPNMPVGVGLQGDESVFILSENGQLMTRGKNIRSFKPNGEIDYENIEQLKVSESNISDLSCGYFHRGLLRQNGSPVFKGIGYCGELGNGSSFSYSGNIRMVKTGFQISAIICEDNTLWMAGRNDFYQLCDSTGTHSDTFVKVADNIIDIAPGNGFTLYVDTDNVLWGIGRNHLGQLGDNTTVDRPSPVKIMEGVEKVYTSTNGYFCACLTTGQELYTWGDNGYNQLGRSSGENGTSPVSIMSDVIEVALGETHGLALSSDYRLFSWGNNRFNQIGANGSVNKEPTLMAEGVIDIAAGPNTTLVVYRDGRVSGWGRRANYNFGTGGANAQDYVISEGYPCEDLNGVTILPGRFELKLQSEFAFSALPQPLDADYEAIEWSSDNTDIVRVDEKGRVYAEKLGEAVVTAKFTDRYGNVKSASAHVICTDTPNNSGIDSVMSGSWSVSYENGVIIVEDAIIGANYSVYNMQGILVSQQTCHSSRLSFEIPVKGVYIVHCEGMSIKVPCL